MKTFTAGNGPASSRAGLPDLRLSAILPNRLGIVLPVANMTIHSNSADADHSPAARHLVDMPGERIDRQKRPCRSPAGALPTPLMRAPLPLIGRS